jgi:hypothetical protein
MTILGTLGMIGCVAWSIVCASSYVGHRDTGDQAGFALGMLFLVSIGIPITGALLAAGAAGEEAPRRTAVVNAALAASLGAGALFFLAGAALYFRFELAPSRPGTSTLFYASYLLTLFAFALELIGFAWITRPGSRGLPPWLPAMFGATTAVAAIQAIALLGGGGPGMVMLLLPTLAWIVVLLRGAVVIVRRAAPSPTS